MPDSPPSPVPFLDVRTHDVSKSPGLTGLCAGYETSEWRADRLAAHLIEWLPEFALTYREIHSLGPQNTVRLLSRAAEVIYNTRTASTTGRTRRGEIGELLLHIGVRQIFKSVPAISKFFYKDSANDTVKGFDAVHVVATEIDLELWLGEVKFYSDIGAAIRDVVEELALHTARDYMRGEFSLITNKIDDSWPFAERLKQLIDTNTPLDQIFDAVVIPVFLTFESPVVCSHTSLTDEFKSELCSELERHYGTFCGKSLPENVRIHLFLFPMKCKQTLVEAFDRRLTACQSIFN